MLSNDVRKVIRMTVYSGEYKSVRKSGYNNWAKVLMHCCPVLNPMQNNERVVPIDTWRVPMWVDELDSDNIIAIAEAVGTPFKEDDKVVGYILTGDDIPETYRYAFTDFGMTLHCEYIKFPKKMFKVDSNGRFVKSDGKLVLADGVRVFYWEGGLADNSGSVFNKERRIERELSQWKESALPSLTLPQDTNKPEEDTDEPDDEDTGE